MTRVFFNTSIADLERMFEKQSCDPQFRKELHEELAYRTTQRARALKERLSAEEAMVAQIASKNEAAKIGGENLLLNVCAKAQSTQHDELSSARARNVVHPCSEMPQEEQMQQCSCTVESMSLELLQGAGNARTFSAPESILGAWAAIEVLSPATFPNPQSLGDGNPRNVIWISNGRMPWNDGGNNGRSKYNLFYQIILGTISMERAIDALSKVYVDTRVQCQAARGESVLASVMVDSTGRLAGRNPVVISSFGWGVPVALAGKLKALEQWQHAEKWLIAELTKKLLFKDVNGNIIPLAGEHITDAFAWLVCALSLPQELVNGPRFALRMCHKSQRQEVPDPVLLNSFYLKDIILAKSHAQAGRLSGIAKRYLGEDVPDERRNLMHSHTVVRQVLAPSMFPAGAWPSKRRYPLAPLQQCAVNIALHDLQDGGILAVNGPPGTGKTTLLKDIVAAIVTERAKVLATYADPEDAFRSTGLRLKRGAAFLHMYGVDKRIRGFEMVVASSNNKAVENVSVELPLRSAVADGSFSDGYFSSVASTLFAGSSWGVISAVLGNANNRWKFREQFWWDKNCGMHSYLRHVCGANVNFLDGAGIQQVPQVVQQENPPSNHQEALVRWEKAVKNFLDVLERVEAGLARFQAIHSLYDSICRHHSDVEQTRECLRDSEHQLAILEDAFLLAQGFCAEQEALLGVATEQYNAVAMEKPGYFRRIFFRSRYRNWLAAHGRVVYQLQKAHADYEQSKKKLDKLIVSKVELSDNIQQAATAIVILEVALKQSKEEYTALAAKHAGVFVDASFFAQNHKEQQTTPPWLDDGAARLRCDLFEAALALHKAFVDGAAKKIRHNCSILLENFGSKSLGSPEKDSLIPDLWATLFLIVPVISTTFASVGNMLSGLSQDDLGWLLIDEAGQAVPQSAVGALLRAQRAVVVGDPLQIEPIVTLPESLTEKICKEFSVNNVVYSPSNASVQTLADRSSAYIGSFETQFGTREVGVPLLVHRRCSEPMFSISNAVAYENLMVQAKKPQVSSILDVVGPSRWIDVAGSSQEKWCPEEGDATLRLLQEMRNGGCNPDVYIITPFVDVQNNLRNLLKNSTVLAGWASQSREWVKERVGTVHTVQGREAEAVLFVLGAPGAGQKGARMWAGKSPNLLNVAVTRAKEAIYVIGNATAWKRCGVFQTLHDRLVL